LKIGWILALVLVTGLAESAIITVGPNGCDYSSIQKAVNAASPGDTIEINNGTYYENVNVTKSLTIHGKGEARVDANNKGHAINLSANGIVIEGLVVANSSQWHAGIKDNHWNNIIRDNIITKNAGYGIFAISANATITGNIISENQVGMIVGGEKSNISNNKIDKNIDIGIACGALNNCSIVGNTISLNNGIGLFLSQSRGSSIKSNKITSNGDFGIQLYGIFWDISLIDNTVSGHNDSGIYMLIGFNNSVLGNTVTNNYRGLFLDKCHNNLVKGNTIKHNHLGIGINQSDNNTIINNSLYNNTYFAFDDGHNKWDNRTNVDTYPTEKQPELNAKGLLTLFTAATNES
jgi:parallel beta-helix repeat protein